MRISLGDVTLWFDVSGPSVVPRAGTAIERPALVTVHGGPGLDHINLKAELAPLAKHIQVLYYDQRGHGRSDHCTSSSWNLRTWADDLRRLCDVLGLVKPVVLGSSFGGHVALTYAGLFPRHPGGIILALPIAEDLARQLPADTARLLRLPGARHTIFRDRPDIAFPAVEEFIRRIKNNEPAAAPAG
jgi:pimeloyl-ACP methyl ester carboxylesterase